MKRKIINILASLPGFSGYSLYGVLRHPLEAVVLRPVREVKYFWQRGRRGYSDRDAWDLYSYLDSWLPAAIRSLKFGHSTPCLLVKKDWNKASNADWEKARRTWRTILENMAVGFEASQALCDLNDFRSPRYRELKRQRDRGLALFVKYYESLCD